MNINKKIAFITLIICSCWQSSVGDVEKPTIEILQFKMNRFYFPVGEEENVFADCPFVVYDANDTLYKGRIEMSLPGISYSFPVADFPDSINIDSCHAVISAAEIDSLNPIIIGLPKSPFADNDYMAGVSYDDSSKIDSRASNKTRYGNLISFRYYNTVLEMQIDFESGNTDAYLSFEAGCPKRTDAETISSPAPFYAALIPSISQSFNENGLLTTSLYYRFNESRLSTLFAGDNIGYMHCLYLSSDSCQRMYPYDPEKGRQLLDYLRKRPRKINIAIRDENLAGLGQFFADILNRDKIRTEIISDLTKADIYIEYIPLADTEADTSLYSILNILAADSIEGSRGNYALSEISTYLELYNGVSQQESKAHYLKLAQRELIESFGVFPLLRPTVYFAFGANLKGCSFDGDGILRWRNIRKFCLPEILWDHNQ